MSYKALYRKYRPIDFNDVLGQEHIVATLENIIANNKISHAYLFAGPRGTGKTSVAHVFAREVNRNAAGQVKASLLDIIEIDAASNNGVSEIRNIIDGARYAPSESRYKVYIIDETHMLTKGAFNALLKTLEEPPEHIIFILATTEPEKVPITILSRLQRFNFRRISSNTIINQLKDILNKENIKYDGEAIRFIARLARGGMRDAISIADQAAAYGNNNVTFEGISQVFGLISIQNQIEIINLAFKGDSKGLLTSSVRFIDGGVDIERLTMSLIEVIKDFIVYKKTSDASLLETITFDESNKLEITIGFAYEFAEVFMKLLSELRFSQVPRQSFELALLKLVKESKPSNENITQVHKPVIKEKPLEVEKPIIEKHVPLEENQKSFTKETSKEQHIINESVNKTYSDNIFETQETEQKIDDLFEEESKDDLISTDELKLTQETMIEAAEEDANNDMMVEELLSTQEISLNQDQNDVPTEEIDLVSMFSSGDTIEESIAEINAVPLEDEIINLLIQADKNEVAEAKIKIKKANEFADGATSRAFANLFETAGIIAKGKGFILVTYKEDDKVEQVRLEKDTEAFIRFTNKVLGLPLKVFAITLNEFTSVKEKYSQLSANNQLPTPVPISPHILKADPLSEAEEFGTSLFGELFNK